MDEKKVAGANYIFNFYGNVQSLTHNFSNYLILAQELEGLYGKEYSGKYSDEHKDTVRKAIQLVRYYVHVSYIQYASISEALNQEKDNKLIQNYEKIKDAVVIDRKELEGYVVALNGFLVKDIIQNLLNTSQQFVSEVYDSQQQP